MLDSVLIEEAEKNIIDIAGRCAFETYSKAASVIILEVSCNKVIHGIIQKQRYY